MSVALAHFSVGAGIVALALIALRKQNTPGTSLYVALGGLWALIPDARYIVPHDGVAAVLGTLADSRWADVFAGYSTLTDLGVRESHPRAAIAIAFMMVAVTGLSYARYRSSADR